MQTTQSILIFIAFLACAQPPKQEVAQPTAQEQLTIRPGAWQMSEYLPMLQNKNVGLCINHSSTVQDTPLMDTLRSLGLGKNIKVIFTPEHGFTGKADAGEHVSDQETDEYKIVSLFGEKRAPTDADMTGLDVVLFDMQDVGVRFYTYISTMHYMMEAAARNNIPFVVLDRPNPNGSYVDGNILPERHRSFVGMHPIPTVHGLTVGELAKMINEEGWLGKGLRCDLTIVKIKNWDHVMPYSLPVRPSPNLPNDRSIALYPGLCLFEGTIVSVGRGTDSPFQHIGHPDYPDTSYSFLVESREGAKSPPLLGETCFGIDFRSGEISYAYRIEPLIDMYMAMGKRPDFFNTYIKLLAGDLDDQIKAGLSAQEIRATWEPELSQFKELRKKYLLYK
jgi:uncharacterized protein YbbC (DUF1343 family)